MAGKLEKGKPSRGGKEAKGGRSQQFGSRGFPCLRVSESTDQTPQALVQALHESAASREGKKGLKRVMRPSMWGQLNHCSLRPAFSGATRRE